MADVLPYAEAGLFRRRVSRLARLSMVLGLGMVPLGAWFRFEIVPVLAVYDDRDLTITVLLLTNAILCGTSLFLASASLRRITCSGGALSGRSYAYLGIILALVGFLINLNAALL